MIRTISPGDDEWPSLLDETPFKRPTVLYAAGRPFDRDASCIAIVGTRRPTLAGVEIAQRLARGLSQAGFTIVSGLAAGIDAAAHQAALDADGKTVAVLGCGIDVTYPRSNAKLRDRIFLEGTVLSEYEAGTEPQAFRFPERNRIVAGMSLGVVVVEGALKSGALITARLAIEADRNVYAVPGSLRNAMAVGPNTLIARGEAQLVMTFKDICDDLAPRLVWESSPAQAAQLDPSEAAVLDALDDVPAPPDKLIGMLEMPPGRVAMLLSRLEVRGWAVRSAAGYSISGAGARVRTSEG